MLDPDICSIPAKGFYDYSFLRAGACNTVQEKMVGIQSRFDPYSYLLTDGSPVNGLQCGSNGGVITLTRLVNNNGLLGMNLSWTNKI